MSINNMFNSNRYPPLSPPEEGNGSWFLPQLAGGGHRAPGFLPSGIRLPSLEMEMGSGVGNSFSPPWRGWGWVVRRGGCLKNMTL